MLKIKVTSILTHSLTKQVWKVKCVGHFFSPVGGTSVTNPGRKQKKPIQKPKEERSSFQNTYNLLYHPASLSFIPFFSISVIFIGLRVARMSRNNYGESPYTHLTTAIQICPVHNDISHIITDFLTCGLALTAHTC